MKLCMSHNDHKSMPDAKFESESELSFIFGDMTSQNFTGEQVNEFEYLHQGNGFQLKMISFYVQKF